MRTLLLPLVLAGLVASPIAAAAQAPTTVPKPFRGEWNATLEDCGTGMNDSRLIIGARDVRYYESGGRVLAAVTRGRFELALVLELSGEGETWMTTAQYALSPDGKKLTDMDQSAEQPMVRYRCPAKP